MMDSVRKGKHKDMSRIEKGTNKGRREGDTPADAPVAAWGAEPPSPGATAGVRAGEKCQ